MESQARWFFRWHHEIQFDFKLFLVRSDNNCTVYAINAVMCSKTSASLFTLYGYQCYENDCLRYPEFPLPDVHTIARLLYNENIQVNLSISPTS